MKKVKTNIKTGSTRWRYCDNKIYIDAVNENAVMNFQLGSAIAGCVVY